MSLNYKDRALLRDDEKSGYQKLDNDLREHMIKTYVREEHRPSKAPSRFGVRAVAVAQFYTFLYVFVHAIFSVYIRFRIAYHAVYDQVLSILKYHHNTPDYVQKDVAALPKLPSHLSVILTLEDGGRRGDAMEKLISEVAEVAAWCASAGIPNLSVYERTGRLKQYMPQAHNAVSQKLRTWFGKHQAPATSIHSRGAEPVQTPNRDPRLGILILSADDGREAMVDLTKVFAEMAQRNKLSVDDITTKVIDNELSNAVMADPDLLISFEPYVDLQGYPPWHIRLTEIFCAPDNQGVGYQVFLRALRKYSEATFKLGK